MNTAVTCKTSSMIDHSHGRYSDSSNTGVTNIFNDGCILLAVAVVLFYHSVADLQNNLRYTRDTGLLIDWLIINDY